MIGFGFCHLFVKNESARVFFTTYWILLTDDKIAKNVLKTHEKGEFSGFFWADY